jgi:hypothetical protein
VESVEPLELVVELRSRGGVSVGQVEAADGNAGYDGPDIAAVDVVGIARQAAVGLLGLFAPSEDGDAVPRLLTVPDRFLARVADGVDRKLLVDRLQLLQAGDVGLRGCEPVKEHGEAGVDAVDVVGGDFHGAILHGSVA